VVACRRMDSPQRVKPWFDGPRSFTSSAQTAVTSVPRNALAAVFWAGIASTLYRMRRGEGALLAVNFSLIAYQGGLETPVGLAGLLVSVMVMGLMYAFNDLYDAPLDVNNPKKDRSLIAAYLEHRSICSIAIWVLSLLTIGLAFAALGARPAVMVAAVFVVNVIYSTLLKGAPVIDVVWCGLWGALFAVVIETSPSLLVLVGLMTAVCHLYQTLDDRAADAANHIVTTAVRSAALSRNVLAALSLLLFFVLRPWFGDLWALTAFVPLALYFVSPSARVAWLLSKVYFGIMWLSVLELGPAAG
jgi:4-hydroxybenzoate polyprenyltransferase